MAATTTQKHIHDIVMGAVDGGKNSHRRNTSVAANGLDPDPRSYSGRNPVPRIELESLWDLYPGRDQSLDGDRASLERQKKIVENGKVVVDPITGKSVSICDAKYAPPPEAVMKPPELYPPVSWYQFMEELRLLTIKYIIFVIAVFITFNGCLSIPYSISVLAAIGGGITWWRNVGSVWSDIVHSAQTEQGLERMHVHGIEGSESAEWLNGIISKLWPQINADLFSSIVDLIEDVMQASIPSVLNQVRITNVGQGTTPMRILSLRWLDEDEDLRGATDWLDEQEEVGEWACLEVAFAYRASPSSSSAASKAKNANLLIYLTLGLKGVVATPIPVWVELRGCTGICRLRIQLISDPPFVKLATFTLMGMPKIEIAAVPLNQRFFNVMNLPVISDFINCSIKTAVKRYVAPSNYTLDLSRILVGEDTKKDLQAIGVLVVNIHSAEGIIAADLNGKSDCYVTLSYSKFAKPLWSTRIIFSDLNPVWDETAVLLVDADEVKASEMLSVTLWDSDRFTADDIVGRTQVDVTELVRNRGKTYKRKDSLHGFKDGHRMPGCIKWSVVFHGKQGLNQDLATDGADERLPQDFRDAEDFRATNGKVDSRQETRVRYIPPDPSYPSGILSIQIHNIVALERHSVTGSKGNPASRRGGQSAAFEEEESENLPSAYCSIILDHEKIYKTRVKPMTSKPFFNAGTERFVRDFRASTVLIAVLDSRLREIDPILGVIEFRLRDVLKNSSMISRYYPLQGGIGYGKIRVSLLFRSIDAQLPKQILGSDIGSLLIVSKHISAENITDKDVRNADYVTFQVPLTSKRAPRSPDGNGWCPISSSKHGFRLGVRQRHSVPCILYFRRDSKIRRDKTHAAAVLWLKDIPDDEDTIVRLDVFQPQDMDGFIQNCSVEGQIQKRAGKHVGYVDVVVRFHRELALDSRAHQRAAEENPDFADAVNAEQCIVRDEPTALSMDSSVSSGSDAGTSSAEAEDDEDTSGASSDGDVGGIRPIKGFKRRISRKRDLQRELHRQERGVMQWKGARTLVWVGKGVKDAGKGVKGHFKMEPRRPNVETEVS